MNDKMSEERIVTIFPNIENTYQPHHVPVSVVLNRIKNGGNKKRETLSTLQKIWQSSDKKEQGKLKGQLPCICFSGKFQKRNIRGILDHSGLVCLDYDNLGDNLEATKAKIQAIKYTYACFISPRKDGLKIIIKIPKDIGNHGNYVEALGKYYPKANYDEFLDVSRVCYESYDPDIYINENSHLFDMKKEDKPAVRESIEEEEKILEAQVLYKNIKKWQEARDDYYDGNKYKFLVSFVGACNRYGLDAIFVTEKVKSDYQYAAEFVSDEDFYDIVRRIYINYEEQHGISWMTKKGEMSDYNPEGKARDVIYLKDIEKLMVDSFLHGDTKGDTTYFKSLDPHFTWRKGEVTLWHGLPNHGKTTVLIHLMLIKAMKDGTKWGIFSPEQNPPIDFYKELAEMYIGKSTDPDHDNQMTLDEYYDAMKFINQYFFFIYPEKDEPTPQYINDRFEELILKEGIEGCVIDPFNQLDNDYSSEGGRDDQYISTFLAKEKRFALKHNVYKIIVAHPKGGVQMVSNKTEKEFDNAGNYECPGVYHLAGGAMWNNKCDNIIVVYQPYYNTRTSIRNKQDWEDKQDVLPFHLNTTVVRSQKVKKQKLVGKPGTAFWVFDPNSSRFYEDEQGKDMTTTPFSSGYILGGSTDAKGYEASDQEWDAFRKKIDEDDKKIQENEEKREEDILLELGINVPVANTPENVETETENLSTPSQVEDNFEGFVDDYDDDYHPNTERGLTDDDEVPF